MTKLARRLRRAKERQKELQERQRLEMSIPKPVNFTYIAGQTVSKILDAVSDDSIDEKSMVYHLSYIKEGAIEELYDIFYDIWCQAKQYQEKHTLGVCKRLVREGKNLDTYYNEEY